MLQQLISHSPDIQRLSNEGYDLDLNGAYLLVHHIPYVNSSKEVKYGTIVTVLTLESPNRTSIPQDHTVFFCGDKPCDAQGQPLTSIINSSGDQQITPTIKANHYFSSKPVTGKYQDFYEKIRTYAEILGAQARIIDSEASAKPLAKPKKLPAQADDSVFQYPDTNSARARLEIINEKFTGQRIGIVGLGGTGSYILDLVAKTPVAEIHLFDGDEFQLHNAFRAPGAVDGRNLDQGKSRNKVDYFAEIYGRMHKGIRVHPEFISAANIDNLSGLDFVFVSVDKNGVRHQIVTHLVRQGVPCIDVGLGVNLVDESLIATIRVTTASRLKFDHLDNRIGQDEPDVNEYASNIQIADLNCLNAVLAVIKWKKIVGFYQDLRHEHNNLYFTNTGKLMNDDITA
ncbi:MAG: ThiF family adenylyltransferase [Bacteroidota bacterium]|nr:ThiF family adenylyltransferase [Bacteroidota bacterium]MDP4257418.1 ThiF family adenylyltransferase [Bacteroidota bacterium]